MKTGMWRVHKLSMSYANPEMTPGNPPNNQLSIIEISNVQDTNKPITIIKDRIWVIVGGCRLNLIDRKVDDVVMHVGLHPLWCRRTADKLIVPKPLPTTCSTLHRRPKIRQFMTASKAWTKWWYKVNWLMGWSTCRMAQAWKSTPTVKLPFLPTPLGTHHGDEISCSLAIFY